MSEEYTTPTEGEVEYPTAVNSGPECTYLEEGEGDGYADDIDQVHNNG